MSSSFITKMASTPSSQPSRQKCFLCEVPRGPWAMLYDFAEPICRACCNYEGIDRIAEVIEKARHLRRSYESGGAHTPNAPEIASIRSPHEMMGFLPAVTVANAIRQSIASAERPRPSGPTYAVIDSPRGKVQVVAPVSTKPHGFTIPGLSQAFTRMQPVSIAVPSNGAPLPAAFAMHPKTIPITDTIATHDTTTQRFAQIQDTLNVLSKSPPFRVRFSKDHSLVGRVIAFDAVCRGSDYELKVFIEYPVGSGTVFQSASGAGRQMYGEFRERLGIGGGFRGASSNGYKDLEFERIFGDDDWRMLGELLTEEVRFFRGPVKKELLPTPYVDSKFPSLPPATLNATRGFLKNNLFNRKRRSSNEEEGGEARKERRIENGTGGAEDAPSHSPKRVGSPSQHVSLHANGVARSPTSPRSPPKSKSPTSPRSPPKSKSPTNGQVQEAPMQCMLCHRTLEDTRFVQCPSAPLHKFCFACSRESIKKQSAASSDVYCPSGMKCLVMGSTTPWAFMEQEIATILGENH